MTYYYLNCKTCNERFRPLLATEPGELLCPDYEDTAEDAGKRNAEKLEDFHDRHSGHVLEELVEEVPAQPNTSDPSSQHDPTSKELL